MEGFHENLERFDFLYFIWAYEKVLKFTYYFQEFEQIEKLVQVPKKPFSSRYRLTIAEMNCKDIAVFLEACRNYCQERPYNAEYIEGLFDKGITVLEK